VDRVRAARRAIDATGSGVVLTGRSEGFIAGRPDLSETIRRLEAYADAGADCVFAPGIRDLPTIARLAKDVGCPLNVLAVPGSPTISELNSAGVNRVSLGSGPMRAAIGLLRRLAAEVKNSGSYKLMEGAPSHAEMNQLMNTKHELEN